MSVAASTPSPLPAADAVILNRPIAELPARCQVLVVGAGPAGSAAALTLARAGLDVVMVDQQAFPRDKVCGDGLIADAHQALHRLGLLDEVMARARILDRLTLVAPRGGRVDVPATLSVLPRKQLDLIVCRGAAAAGVRMFAPLRFVGALEEQAGGGTPQAAPPRVIGARLKAGAVTREILADWVVLASGAVPQALLAVGLCRRRTPSGIALRGYLRNPAMSERITTLEVAWHPALRRGYGWVFPCGDGVFNVGVGIEHSHARRGEADDDPDDGKTMGQVNLREMLKTYGRVHPQVGELVSGGQWLGDVKGAPLRCSLSGADWSRPGLLVAGEAAGSTYAFTGEGIGKALQTGILAAQAVIDGVREGHTDAEVRAHYGQTVLALKPRFAVYERAQVASRRPWLVDLLVWSANRSPARIKRLTGVLEETYLPRDPLSFGSLRRLLFERG